MFKSVEYPFKEYVLEQELEIKMAKKWVYYLKDDKPCPISKMYFEIRGIELLERKPKEFIYNTEFVLTRNKDKLYQCEVSIPARNKTIRFLEKTFDDCINDNLDLIYDKTRFIALCRRYFKYVLINERENFIDYAFLTGWEGNSTDRTYISVNSVGCWDDKYLDLKIFNGFYLNKENQLSCRIKQYQSNICGLSKEEVIKHTQQFNLLFNNLINCRELMGIFAYTIHSLLWYYCANGRGTWTPLSPQSRKCESVFSICIYGKNIDEVKCIANIFCNLYYVDMERAKNGKASHSISATSLNNRFLMWRYWNSIPVIVTSKGYNLNRNSSIIKRLYKYRQAGSLYFFPVYLNKGPINIDENEDFNINHISGRFKSPDEMQLLKDEISCLLLNFVLYLSDVSKESNSVDMQKKSGYNRVHNVYQNTISKLLETDTFNQDEQMNFALLYSAIRGFCYFLESYMNLGDIAKYLEHQAYEYFLTNMPDDGISLCFDIENNDNDNLQIIMIFNSYINYLFNIPEKNRPFMYYIGDEKIGLRETCYYLESKEFYKHFLFWNTGQSYANITELKLKQTLRYFDLLIMRSNGKQYSCERWHTSNNVSKKYSFLIIRKDKLNQLIEK